MSKLTVIAIITAKAGCEENVREGLTALISPTLEEAGCLNYDLHLDNGNPRVFAFHENWQSEAHLNDHLESEHIIAFQNIAEGIVESVQMFRMTAVE